ncbi:MAG: Mur ligase family protein [Aggregatilineales bacterium]
MRFKNEYEAISYVFQSIARINYQQRGLDENTRDITPTKRLLAALDLPQKKMEYVVVTGSKGKGSVSAITAKLLTSLGHKVGLVTSPHLNTYRQRFRIDGRMISEETLIRLLDQLAPTIDRIASSLNEGQYLSPQGIFLALALTWFKEQGVTAAIIEVGRGGRYDDNALVPNMLSLFTPILLEHTRYLGDSVERIAWHKAGIIEPQSYAFSLPQTPEVMDVLRKEAELQEATLEWLAPMDLAQYVRDTENGMIVDFGRYGELELPMLGRYEIDNASLAVWAAGNVHNRLNLRPRIAHGSPDYVARIRAGLETIIWPGRTQKMQDSPQVFVDGALNIHSAKSYIESLKGRLSEPVVLVLAVPVDRNMDAVYREFAPLAKTLILTRTDRNITIHFPDEATARPLAEQYYADVIYTHTVAEALDVSRKKTGESGTVVMSIAQPAIGDLMAVYGEVFEQI